MTYQIHEYNETEIPSLKREELVLIRRDLGRDWTIAGRELRLAIERKDTRVIALMKKEIAELEPKMSALSAQIAKLDRSEEK